MKELDWANLKFGYLPTDYNVRCNYHNGKWGEIEISSDPNINLSMAASSLHYGQEAFEGLKAYRCPDGKVRVFRVEENAARLQSTSRGIMMPEVPTELFVEMVERVVRLNQKYIPPYESGATLYIRPLLIGTTRHFDLLQTMGFALGSGVGYVLAVLVVREGARKMDNEDVPATFRGLPVTLLYIGILALAIYGFTGHLISF